ncbi:hypothetical protein H5T51_08845 [Candidatus Bathyarchaeota archaeon]|nr:hypothetical protein [Candidatus Bathyarchaeota archaeon]
MLLICEVAVKGLLPSIRAVLAEELTQRHNLKQTEAARILGISQPAISLYLKKLRGKAVNLEQDMEIKKLIAALADLLAEKHLSNKEFITKFCEICRIARAKGLLCGMHSTLDPNYAPENCQLCMTETPSC